MSSLWSNFHLPPRKIVFAAAPWDRILRNLKLSRSRLGLNRRRSVDEAADRLGMSIRPWNLRRSSFGFESAEKRRWGSKSIGDVDSSLKSLERLSPKLSPRRRENQEKGEKKRHGATFPTLFRLPIECCHVPRKDEAQRPKLKSVYNVIRSFWFISRPNINKNGLWDER